MAYIPKKLHKEYCDIPTPEMLNEFNLFMKEKKKKRRSEHPLF